MTGTELLHIPYKGSAPAITDLLGGQIAIMFDNMPSAIQHVRSGKLRPIAVTTAKRSPELPDVPTIQDEGIDVTASSSWNCTPSNPSFLYCLSFWPHSTVGRTGGPNGSAPSCRFQGPNENRYCVAITTCSSLRVECPR